MVGLEMIPAKEEEKNGTHFVFLFACIHKEERMSFYFSFPQARVQKRRVKNNNNSITCNLLPRGESNRTESNRNPK
ncbi:hypothetical protein RJT34_05182 [Clitoria ternatea]|uniref:Uncharacterized protein n=1 Tax=Clitoria ternatea TaxID=43366 RepID=A0AAN9K2P2_CLITE